MARIMYLERGASHPREDHFLPQQRIRTIVPSLREAEAPQVSRASRILDMASQAAEKGDHEGAIATANLGAKQLITVFRHDPDGLAVKRHARRAVEIVESVRSKAAAIEENHPALQVPIDHVHTLIDLAKLQRPSTLPAPAA